MKRIGIKDVAARAGVSISTVSNALNRPGVVSEALVERVNRAVAELGYAPMHAARQLRVGRSGLIGMSVINIGNPFFADVVSGVETASAAAGLRVMVGNSDDDTTKETDHLDLFERIQVEGVVASPFADIRATLRRLHASGIPVVLVDASDDEGVLDSVTFDDVAGGRMAAEHLIALGRRRLAFIGAREEVRQVRDRLAGATAVVDSYADATLAVEWSDRTTARLGRRFGTDIAARPREQWPDGILATNDHLGCGIVHGLVSGGVRVPEDIAVVGYDDIEFAAVAAVPLTSIRQPAREMGTVAAQMIADRIAGKADPEPRTVVFAPELIARASTMGQEQVTSPRRDVTPTEAVRTVRRGRAATSRR